jgi:parallel beta-helix repeat protein
MFTHRITIGLAIVAALAVSAQAQIHNITQDTYHPTIQEAIGAAVTGDEIEVGPGTYHERINLLGKAITLRSTDGPATTIIDGDAGGSVITCINSEGPDTVIEGFTVTNGSAFRGGGMYNEHSSPTVANCTFRGNSATNRGGGIDINNNSTPALTNCTLSGNSTSGPFGNGGGMAIINNSTPTLTNCTFSGNSTLGTFGRGGGMYSDNSSPTLTNCILWGNDAPAGPQIFETSGGSTTVTYSCIHNGWSGTGNVDADPLFADADGPDGVFGTPDDDVHLLDGSPCINAGDNAAVPGGVSTDFDGEDRVQQCRVDMGVDETPYAGVFIDCNGNDVPDECDIASGTSQDGDGDGIPDECEPVHNITQNTYHPTIQEAIDTAIAGDEIEVTPGTYHERINLLGRAITLRSTDGPAVTIIDGDAGGGSVITCTNSEGPETVIEGFTVTDGMAEYGGGMYNDGSSPTLVRCTFHGNSVRYLGGGMYNDNSSNPILANCTFNGNRAVFEGGGIYNGNSSNPTLTNCTFSGNWATYGGGVYNMRSSPTLANCTFSGNWVDYRGGGMYNSGDYTGDSSPALTNCTFGWNSGGDYGGGMYNIGDSSPTLANCIVWGNTARYGSQIYSTAGVTITVTNSCIQGGWAGAGNIFLNPQLIAQGGGALRLRRVSPCIDAGNNAAVSPEVTTDVAGNPRFVDAPETVDNGIGTAPIVDMGAYEFQPTDPADIDVDGDVDLDDFALFALQFTGPY